jgi:hypothetical protein
MPEVRIVGAPKDCDVHFTFPQTETSIQENRKVTEVKSAVALRNTCPWPVELAVHPRGGGCAPHRNF